MKALGLLGLLVILFSCGDEEVVEKPIEPKEELSEIEKVYADLRGRFTHQEFQFFLETVQEHCKEGNSYNSGTHRKLKQRLSTLAYSAIYASDGGQKHPFRIPTYTRHKDDRIRIAAREHDSIAIFRAKRAKVVYLRPNTEATIIVETDLNTFTKLYRIRVDAIMTGDGTRHEEVRSIERQLEELNEQHNGSDKPLPIELPAVPNDLPLVILVFNEHSEPIPPTPEKQYQWIFDYDEAPTATDEQIEQANKHKTPSAYDCIEN